jgi:DNA-binding MarR family transcriptional regulator
MYYLYLFKTIKKITIMAKTGYERTIKLNHNEVPARVNLETGNIEVVKDPLRITNNTDSTLEKFDLFQVFQRVNTAAWELLSTQVKANELAVAMKLALRAKAYTNSLEPLNPDTSMRSIAEQLKVEKNTIAKIIDKLFKLGVIGKFEVYNDKQEHTKFWVFNPYLTFNGKHIKKDVRTLFDNTYFAKVMRGSNYES